jgi:hypothetical protein
MQKLENFKKSAANLKICNNLSLFTYKKKFIFKKVFSIYVHFGNYTFEIGTSK